MNNLQITLYNNHYDFYIDGQSLALMVFETDDLGETSNDSPYSLSVAPRWRWKQHQALLGNVTGDLVNGHVGLYSCALCHDPSNMVVSAKVNRLEHIVTWQGLYNTDLASNEADELVNTWQFDAKDLTRTLGTVAYELDYIGLRQILSSIDFLDVADMVSDEYDCMLSDLLSILHDDGAVSNIREYLNKELTEHFGFECISNRNLNNWAKQIYNWYIAWPKIGA